LVGLETGAGVGDGVGASVGLVDEDLVGASVGDTGDGVGEATGGGGVKGSPETLKSKSE
jgi:hypothetical protein